MSISANVVIMTRDELEAVKAREYARGVARGRFEEGCERSKQDTPRERAVEKQDPVSPDAGGGPFRVM